LKNEDEKEGAKGSGHYIDLSVPTAQPPKLQGSALLDFLEVKMDGQPFLYNFTLNV